MLEGPNNINDNFEAKEPQVGDPIPDDHEKNRPETIRFVENQIVKLKNLPSLDEDQKIELESYEHALLKLKEKQELAEKEAGQLAPLRSATNGVLRFINPLKSWENIQTPEWLEIGRQLTEAKSSSDTGQIKTGLNQWLEISKANLNKKGFGESELSESLQRRAVKDIEKFLEILNEYESKGIPVPWDKI